MTIYRFGPFLLEKQTLLLSVLDAPIALGPKVVETLLALVERAGEVLGKNELLDRVWPEGFVEEANLAQNIYVLRKVLRAHYAHELIQTVPRRGYRFVASVEVETRDQIQAPRQVHVVLPLLRRRPALAKIAAAVVMALAVAAAGAQVATRAHAQSAAPAELSSSGARLYAIGTYYWNQRTASSVAKSVRYFTAVTQSDPRDARGYAGLAAAYAIDADYGYGGLSKAAALSRAAAYADGALRIDGRCAAAHAVLGLVAVDRNEMSNGFAQYRLALALDPDFAPAHQWYGASLLLAGQSGLAYSELQKAAELDPESVAATDWLSHAAFIARRYKDAIAYSRQTLDMSPQRYGVYETMGMAYEALRDYPQAVAAYEAYARTCEMCRYDAAALLAHVFAATHQVDRARQLLREAQRGFALRETSSDNMVAALLAMGRKNDALAMLSKGKDSEPRRLLAVDPRMDALRNDARFRQYTQDPG